MKSPAPASGVPSGPEFSRSFIQRAWEAPEEVVMQRHIIESPALQPEDIGVLARLLIRDPAQPATIVNLAREFQAAGWKMGESRFTAILKRLKAAGHVEHVSEFNPATGRPHWVFKVYRNPANNARYVDQGSLAASQVRPENEVSTVSGQPGSSETVDSTVSPGQDGSVESTVSGADPWISGIRKTTVSRGQSRNRGNRGSAAHPPHPPEEVETSSPYPLNTSNPGREEAEAFPPEEILAAEHFLQTLPAPWTVGRQTAKRQAPNLLEAAREQGWDLDDTLRAELTKNPGGIKNYPAVLKTRIADLPLRAAVAQPTRIAGNAAARPVALPRWCEDLDCDQETRRRTVTDQQGFTYTGPCPECHPDIRKDLAA